MRSVLALTIFVAACSSSSGVVGDACDPSDRSACGDGLACESVGVNSAGDVNICTWECDAPSAGGGQCGPDAACVAVPSGITSCLALCDESGGCAYGEPGYPFIDSDTCVCIPWR